MTPRLRVLAVAAREPWPLDHGGRLRLYHLLTHLADTCDVTLAVPHAPEHAACYGGVDVCEMRASGLPAPPPVREWTLRRAAACLGRSPQMAAWLHENARRHNYDAVLLSGAWMGQYCSSVHIPAIWDLVDELVSPNLAALPRGAPAAWPGGLRAGLMAGLYQRAVARRVFATTFCSPVDARAARCWIGAARCESVGHGIDLRGFAPQPEPPEPDTLAFAGALDFPPNVDGLTHFVQRVWPLVRLRRPHTKLRLIGRDPAPAVQRLAGLPGIELIGPVPEVQPHLARAAAVVVPLRYGGGVKNKVLEACALGRPVIASPAALTGLSAVPGRDLLRARRPADWAQRIGAVLGDAALAARLGAAARAWVVAAFDWSRAAARLLSLLHESCGLTPPRAAPLARVRCAPGATVTPNGAQHATDLVTGSRVHWAEVACS